MIKKTKRYSKLAGLAPGTLVHVGRITNEKTRITAYEYNESQCAAHVFENIESLQNFKFPPGVVRWINIDGLNDVAVIEKMGSLFGLSSLVLEDIVNTSQRPKLVIQENYMFIVFKMIYPGLNNEAIIVEQVSLILGPDFVLSFQEESRQDVFDPLRKRIQENVGRIRKAKADYLAFSLMDAVVDNYFLVLEKMGDQIEVLEDQLLGKAPASLPRDIHALKRGIIDLRKQVWPLRELCFELSRQESALIDAKNEAYFRDIYDHVIQVIDTIESFRDLLAGLHDIYLSFVSNRLNEVMKILTIISTIFIPLTFIVGVYGMNFKFMPELEWRPGYFVVWGIMLGMAAGMAAYFKKKQWL